MDLLIAATAARPLVGLRVGRTGTEDEFMTSVVNACSQAMFHQVCR